MMQLGQSLYSKRGGRGHLGNKYGLQGWFFVYILFGSSFGFYFQKQGSLEVAVVYEYFIWFAALFLYIFTIVIVGVKKVEKMIWDFFNGEALKKNLNTT